MNLVRVDMGRSPLLFRSGFGLQMQGVGDSPMHLILQYLYRVHSLHPDSRFHEVLCLTLVKFSGYRHGQESLLFRSGFGFANTWSLQP